MSLSYSIVIPAYNEKEAIGNTIERLLELTKKNSYVFEIVVVDDGSSDGTGEAARHYPVVVVENLQNLGYGQSLKRGILASRHDHIIITDADGTYPIESLSALIREYEKGYDMVVGARQGKYYRGSFLKHPARLLFLWLAEFAAGRKIPDINSGLRVFKKSLALKYFHTLCAGFSFTTTITLAALLNFHPIVYLPIEYHARIGKSKVRYFRDTLRTAQIIVEAILFYNPIKIYILCGLAALAGGIGAAVLSLLLPGTFVWMLLFGYLSAVIAGCIGLGVVYLKFMNREREGERL